MDDPPRRLVLGSLCTLALAGCLDRRADAEGTASNGTGNTTRTGDDGTETVSTGDGEAGPEPGDSETGDKTTPFPDYPTTRVAVRRDGEELGAVTAAVADTRTRRVRGLSDTEVLPDDWGMLFVFSDVADRTFVMREMDFAIDIVYADDEGYVTAVHTAPAPAPDEDGSDQEYRGRGQYVLEVNAGWMAEYGAGEGDRLVFDL